VAIAYLGRHQAHTNFPVEEYAAEWRELEELRVDDAIALVKRRARSAKLLARQRREGSAAAGRADAAAVLAGEGRRGAPRPAAEARAPKPVRAPARTPRPDLGAAPPAAAAPAAAPAAAAPAAAANALAPPPLGGSWWGFPAVPPLALALNCAMGMPLRPADAVVRPGPASPARPVACRAQLPEAVLAHLGLERLEALRGAGEGLPAAAAGGGGARGARPPAPPVRAPGGPAPGGGGGGGGSGRALARPPGRVPRLAVPAAREAGTPRPVLAHRLGQRRDARRRRRRPGPPRPAAARAAGGRERGLARARGLGGRGRHHRRRARLPRPRPAPRARVAPVSQRDS